MRLDLKTFIKRARIVHNNKYDYSSSVYESSHANIEIYCKEHGYFLQTPANHLSGKGCFNCGIVSRSLKKRIPYSDFLKKAIKVHKSTYIYNENTYKGFKEKMCITCRIHGDFSQSPEAHLLLKQGCPTCGRLKSDKNRVITFDTFKKRAKKIHGEKYRYFKNTYSMMTAKTKILCNICGNTFHQMAGSHLSGKGCLKCATRVISDSKLKSTSEFIKNSKEKHGNRYDYSLVSYIKGDVPVKIVCLKHGIFLKTPYAHLGGIGCPKCTKSRGELAVEVYLTNKKIKFITNKRFKDCRNKKELPFDFYLVDFNACIEFDGEQHYKEGWFSTKDPYKLSRTKKNDKIKNKYCIQKGIPLKRIPYTKIKKIPEIVSNFIKNLKNKKD